MKKTYELTDRPGVDLEVLRIIHDDDIAVGMQCSLRVNNFLRARVGTMTLVNRRVDGHVHEIGVRDEKTGSEYLCTRERKAAPMWNHRSSTQVLAYFADAVH